jgi:4-amino-4-deoxy-L-arabinose transferase-like glycosyltransferase
MTDRRAPLLLLVPVFVFGVILARGYDGGDYLRGDCPYYFYTTLSLLHDHDLDLSNQLPGGLSFHFDQVALAKDGRVVPKHPIVMPLAALPFVALLGRIGALVFNVVQILVLVLALYRLAGLVARALAAASAVALTATLSFLPHYVWNFSPDVFAVAIAVLAVLALASSPSSRARDSVGGALLGVACAAKPALAVFVPAALLLVLPAWRMRMLAALAGLAVPLALWAALDVHLFGAPQTTGYDHIVRLGAHGVETYSQRDDFDQPIVKGLKRQLRHPTQGLLATSAITLISWLGLPGLVRRRPALAVAVASGSIMLVLFFARYRLWDSSHYGNRHLLLIVALAALPLAVFVEDVFTAVRRSHRSAPAPARPRSE